jgi:SNF2 family DNA or RNA helicase
MTGTPVPNGLLQLWSQMYLIDMGKRLGKYITHYRLKYFYQKAYDVYNYYLMPGADKLIYAAINDVVMHKSANEINLPPLTFNNINVQLDSITYTIYKEMQEELCVDIGEDDMLYSANQGVNIGKLKQIANGCVYKEDPYNPGKDRIILDLHNEKLNALKDLVEELNGSPLMVIYEYLHDLDKLQRAFPDAPIIGGGTNEKELQKIIIDWNKGNVPVLLLQPKSGGHGLNLQDGGCHDVCWYSITYDLELYVQAIKRVYRQGIKNAVIIHHIVAKGTIDDSIINKLNAKDKVQQLLLEAVEK